MKNTQTFLAAVSGAVAVGLGAFGAHGLEEMLLQSGRIDTWDTAVLYHLVHSVVLLFLAQKQKEPGGGDTVKRGGWSFWIFFGGMVIFSGTLYLLCLTGMTWLGAVTPIGGLALIAGWLSLALKKKTQPD